MKIWLIVGLVLLAGLTWYGYRGAVPVSEDVSSEPSAHFENDLFDFGSVKYGAVLEHTFLLENEGDAPLEIKKAATSCSCTSVSVKGDVVLPGDKVEVEVVYDTGAMSGPHGRGRQDRIIFIKTNDPVHPQIEANITAYVE